MPLPPPPPPPPGEGPPPPNPWGPTLPPPPTWAGPPPPPPPAPPPWEATAARTRRWPGAVGTTLAGLAVLGAAVLLTTGDDTDHPSEWDPRVADLAAFVEDERGLDFDHPVHVDFLTPEEYTEASTDDAGEVPADERTELERYAGQLRALGVASGELDLVTAFNQLSDGGTLAFYDPVDDRVRVRGTELTEGLEVTIVHELTHALQDQRFDLESIFDPALDAGAATAYRALVEGDALRIEDAYVAEELTPAQQSAYEDELAAELEASETATADVPPFVSAAVSSPYALGRPFVLLLLNDGGNDAVDRAFDEPPATEEHLLDPLSYQADEEVAEVDLGFEDDEEVVDEGPFGAIGWYLFLAERIDPKQAFEAALGWGGDAFAGYDDDGADCVRMAFVGDTGDDEAEMAAALDEWAAAMPGGRAEVIEVDGHPGLDACDPGADVDLELTGRTEASLYLPSLWGYLVADAGSQLDPDGSRCYARAVIDGLSYEEITDPEGAAFVADDFQDRLLDAFSACR
jgi:hypothetical protein